MSDIPNFKTDWAYFWELNDSPGRAILMKMRKLAPFMASLYIGTMIVEGLDIGNMLREALNES